MNLSPYPRPQAFLTALSSGQDAGSISWRGYLTRATLLAVGLGGYVLLTRRIDLSANGKRCFYAMRKYFPRSNEKGERSSATTGHENEVCPVCLGSPKTGVRAPCGHLICAKCLARYCEVRRTTEPPCPLCRAPVKSVTLATDVTENVDVLRPSLSDSTTAEFTSRKSLQNVKDYIEEIGGSEDRVDSDRKFQSSRIFVALSRWDNRSDCVARNFITWGFVLVVLLSVKFQVLPRCESLIGYETIFDFLVPLIAVVPTIYIFWIIYMNSLSMLKP